MQLRCCVAVAVVLAGSCSSDSTPSLGTSICHGCGPKKRKKRTLSGWPVARSAWDETGCKIPGNWSLYKKPINEQIRCGLFGEVLGYGTGPWAFSPFLPASCPEDLFHVLKTS